MFFSRSFVLREKSGCFYCKVFEMQSSMLFFLKQFSVLTARTLQENNAAHWHYLDKFKPSQKQHKKNGTLPAMERASTCGLVRVLSTCLLLEFPWN